MRGRHLLRNCHVLLSAIEFGRKVTRHFHTVLSLISSLNQVFTVVSFCAEDLQIESGNCRISETKPGGLAIPARIFARLEELAILIVNPEVAGPVHNVLG
jgi:hypothetical protein